MEIVEPRTFERWWCETSGASSSEYGAYDARRTLAPGVSRLRGIPLRARAGPHRFGVRRTDGTACRRRIRPKTAAHDCPARSTARAGAEQESDERAPAALRDVL